MISNLLHPLMAAGTVVDELSRRRLLGGGAGIAALLLGGCGSDDTSDAAASSTPATTRGFVDATGEEIQVPVRPQRIVATHDLNGGSQILALGGPMIGCATRGDGFNEALSLYFDTAEIERVGEVYQPNIEAIAGLQPDLIVHEGFDGGMFFDGDDTLARLRAVAPVVAIDTFRPVDDVMADFADLLGEAATVAVEDQRRDYEAVLDELRDMYGEGWSDVTASYMSLNDGLEAWGPTALPVTQILTAVGVSWVPVMLEAGSEENGGYIGSISLERMDDFSADLIVVQTFEPELLSESLFQQLPAVQAGQVVEVDTDLLGAHYPNYIAVAEALRDGLRLLGDIRTDIV
jgi:iron complex transport system substrate-binding protein